MTWPINREWKGYWSIESCIHFATLNYDSLIMLMILTLDFQGQILKKLSGMGGSIERKGFTVWIDLVGPAMWPHPWTGIFKVKFLNSYISGMGGLIYTKWKGCEFDTMCIRQPWTLTSIMMWHWIFGFSRSNFKIIVFQVWTDGYETKVIWLDMMMVILCDLTHDFDFGFSRVIKFWK